MVETLNDTNSYIFLTSRAIAKQKRFLRVGFIDFFPRNPVNGFLTRPSKSPKDMVISNFDVRFSSLTVGDPGTRKCWRTPESRLKNENRYDPVLEALAYELEICLQSFVRN